MDSTTTGHLLRKTTMDLDTRPCVLYYWVFGTLVAGSVITIGLIGNALSFVIMSKDQKKSSTVQALCLLAAADTCLLLALSYIPIIGIRKWLHGWYEAHNQTIFCAVYMNEIARICNQISAFLTMSLTWQRYVAVCIPHKAKQLCTIKIVNIIAAVSTMLAVFFYLPNFFLYSIKISDDGIFQPVSDPLVYDPYFQMIYSVILTYLVSYIFPVVSLMYMSVSILRNIKPNSIEQLGKSQVVRKDLTKSSIAIVILFVLCQSFQPIRRILMWIYDPYLKNTLCGEFLFYFSGIPHFSLILNSAANFGIYILFARGFRKKLIALFNRRNAVAPTGTSTDCSNARAPTGTTNDGTHAIAPTGTTNDCTNARAPTGITNDCTNAIISTGTINDGTHAIAPTGTTNDSTNAIAPTGITSNGELSCVAQNILHINLQPSISH
ncbi:hypothetical protein CAPTEDRAFT_212905 [Capitella teleta]|uniref:G-protein coupled receptors family 1 profile domain-containing protein n=1 Tax=Capitella teleta TaxID=283909 RepID=R7TPD5_CAPTE|nr:hypothetical protein CAPTEDRAFT_212905 [Capitella teleta]|eukprot:ELT93361.1 hypothetical protein CAPTEDRAFT_212905 [Capitella teleta]